MRLCSKCGQEKAFSEFYHRDGKPEGHCVSCQRIACAEYRRRKAAGEKSPREVLKETNARLFPQGLKLCSSCEEIKSFSAFGLCLGKRQGWCKKCQLAHQRANPNRKACVRKHRYKILETEFKALKEAQNGVCAICGGPPVAGRAELSVDHCHVTNKVRGLLCQHCNLGLGYFKDSIERVVKAASYLQKYSS